MQAKKNQTVVESAKEEEEEVEILPVEVNIEEVTMDGLVTIKFNQNLIVPFSYSQTQLRFLEELDEEAGLNILDSILDIQVRNNNYEHEENPLFYAEIIEFKETHMKVQIDFEDPLAISNGNMRDKIEIRIKEEGANFFVSEQTGEPLKVENIKEPLVKSIPAQLPKGADREQIEKTALRSTQGFTVIVVVQIVLQLVMKQSIDLLWSMFFVLQLFKAMTIYDIQLQAETLIFMKELRNFIDFQSLQPDFLIKTLINE